MTLTLHVALLAALVPLGAESATPAAGAATDAALEARVATRLAGDRTGACVAVAVIADAVRRAYVCADPAQRGRIGPDRAFEIGSVSKTMTAALLADLIGRGEASLDDPLADYLPEGTAVPAFEGQPILLRHVVTHTSGLPGLPPGAMAAGDPSDPYAHLDARQLLDALGEVRLTRAPGSAFEYSNYASMLLSVAVARRAGQPFETLLDERLFTPLGMDGAHVSSPPAGVRPAQGHGSNAAEVPAWTFAGDLAGVGGVRATLEDMVRYVQGQLAASADAAAPGPALARTQQPVPVAGGRPMAMNWMLAPLGTNTLFAHEGGTGGFSSLVAFDRKRGLGVVALSDTAVHSVGGLSSLALPLIEPAMPMGQPRTVAKAPPAVLDGLVGEYTLPGAGRAVLRRRGDTLFLQVDGQPEFELGYDSAGDFYPLAIDALLSPHAAPGGGQTFAWRQGGGLVEATRTSPPAAAAAVPAQDLAQFAGTYPLAPGFAVTVSVREGQLFIQGTGQQALAAEPAAADVFVVARVGAEFRFERDPAGRVVALVLRQGGQALRGERQ